MIKKSLIKTILKILKSLIKIKNSNEEKEKINKNNKDKFQFISKPKNSNINNKDKKSVKKKIKTVKNESNDKMQINDNNKKIKQPIEKPKEEQKEEPNIPDSYEDFDDSDQMKKPVLIGLLNIGATCYMNATIQCFSHIDRLKNFLLEENIYNDLLKGKAQIRNYHLLSLKF